MNKISKVIYFERVYSKSIGVLYISSIAFLFKLNLISAWQVPALSFFGIGSKALTAKLLAWYSNNHKINTAKILKLSALMMYASLTMFYLGGVFINLAFIVAGSVIGLNEVVSLGAIATQDKSSKTLLRVSVLTDVIRIAAPAMFNIILISFGLKWALLLALFNHIIWCLVLMRNSYKFSHSNSVNNSEPGKNTKLKLKQKRWLIAEFLDSLSSSELYSFMPIILIAKGWSVKSSVFAGVLIFTGYFLGRFILLKLKSNDQKNLIVFEILMLITLIALIVASGSYIYTSLVLVLLGASLRGTSPLIKNLAFNSEPNKTKIASQLVYYGDSGSMLAGFIMGWMVISFKPDSILWLSALIAIVVIAIASAGTTLIKNRKIGYN